MTVDGAMTDPKGDRGLPPGKQADPDLYTHVVEKRKDGIVVRGAKAHQTGAINSHWILVMPTIAMTKEDRRLCPFFCRACRRGRHILYLWTAILRHAETRRR